MLCDGPDQSQVYESYFAEFYDSTIDKTKIESHNAT